ncbi:putative ubiquitination network signaling protein [Phaeoacremonium minimum UCRPA7]|uniref:Putative ubiquitination network signaling protein n=1 Tax=Phaeoacremonium minimum (strain UCR-PA7) TaxID=1286976 RepID=R8BH89_PHAM7|nr:putative ubiquitination network signaling protein [Phaeoacremonium minimum UCRPA7]EON98715.1 putative ubiquitination network signaling protein [Phaeoacremonium minimum UCRPA7]
MPRAPSSNKRQQGAASTRDTRHENGLVGPGKRITRQRSQNPIDGSPRPAADDNAAVGLAAQPATSSSASAPLANGFAKHDDDMAPEHRTTESLRRASLGTYSEASSSESVSMPNGVHPVSEDAPMRIDVNAAKNTNVHRDTGPIDYALTVLRSCPLHDTIAILIILMQLSPVALSSIYMLFTLLTFVPPVTTSSGLSLTDIFDGVSTTSLWTLIVLDLVFFLVWIIVGMQEIVLDFAQVVIALTLGGGASSRAGTTHNIFFCAALILFSHFGRIPAIKRFTKLGALFEGGPFGSPDISESLETSVSAYAKKGAYGWVRSALAIHILMQGIVRYIRDWYLRREKRDQLSQGQLDPEAGKGAAFSGDGSTDGVPNTPDPDIIAQTTATAVSSKKRRKQSAQVRIRQPLWAALASTKIVMVKEYELSHATSESAGSNATDIHNLGNAPFNTQPEQIWICYVGCDEVCFNTSHFPDIHSSGQSHENGNAASSGIDTTKPFYVRVNNAVWQPTRIIPVESGEEEGCQGTRWTGDIYGLTPMSKYECEFVSTRTGEVLFSTSVRTIPAKLRDSDMGSRSHGTPRQYRHESPATTLKNSIAGMEAKLADEKARLKALRKENNRRTNAAKKEIERLTTAVQSAGGNDEKLRQKIAQNSTQQKQAEQSLLELETELKELETIPEEVLTEYRQKQDLYKAEKAQYEGARATYKSVKSSFDDEVKVLEEDQASLQAKRTKIAARLAKVESEHGRITDANARGLDEVDRRRQERAAYEAEQARAEQDYSERWEALRARNDEKTQTAANMAAALQSYINNFNHADGSFENGQYSNTYGPAPWTQSSSHYPNAMWSPGSSGAPAPAIMSTAPGGPPPLFPHQQAPHFHSHPLPKSRGRSSSMLSDISGFTQSTDDGDNLNGSNNGSSSSGNNTASFVPPILNQGSQPSFHAHPSMRGPTLPFVRTRKTSDGGSGSGSALSSEGSSGSRSGGSVRDPTSPI